MRCVKDSHGGSRTRRPAFFGLFLGFGLRVQGLSLGLGFGSLGGSNK